MKIKHFLQGRFLSHPLHGALVHVPIGLFFGSLIFDVLSLFASDPGTGNFFVQASWYCILFGVIFAAPTAVTGFAEFVDLPSNTKVQRYGLMHMTLNVLVVAAYLVHLFVRDRNIESVTTGTLTFNLVCVAALGYSGYVGGKMVYQFSVGSRTPENPQITDSNSPTPIDRSRRVA